MPILGLVSTETYDAERFKNVRRSVQYQYPNGAAILTGLLSLMDEETTNDPQFSHWEKRMIKQRTLTAAGAGAGPFMNGAGADPGSPVTFTADNATTYQVAVDDADFFRVGHVIKIVLVSGELRGLVTAVNTSTDRLTFKAIATKAGVTNDATSLDKEVLVIGTAFAQGRSNVTGEVAYKPVEFYNYTQIFRTPFSLTGTALKTPLKYDESGPHKDKAKEHSVYHMIEMEKAFLFGTRAKLYTEAAVDTAVGTGLPLTTTGGVLYHLERWEAGDYGTVVAAADTDDDKRIIENSGGSIDEDTYDTYLERLFRVTNNTSNEKLALCGSGFLKTINQLYRSKSTLTADLPLTDTYGMNVVRHLTPFGTVFYKTHPLFTQNDTLRWNALFLDVKNLKYRPMTGRDTELLKNRQENDADYRKDEWFTEAGFEMWFPESHLYLKNVQTYSP